MSTCNSCGGAIGRDCFNPVECESIAEQEKMAESARLARDSECFQQRIYALEQLVVTLELRLSEIESKLIGNREQCD